MTLGCGLSSSVRYAVKNWKMTGTLPTSWSARTILTDCYGSTQETGVSSRPTTRWLRHVVEGTKSARFRPERFRPVRIITRRLTIIIRCFRSNQLLHRARSSVWIERQPPKHTWGPTRTETAVGDRATVSG